MTLSGITVLDLTRVISGPFCTMLLADMGAEVIKVETLPDGDPIRVQGLSPEGVSFYFATFNRNKKSVTLNLKSEEGQALFAQLVEKADVVIDNFRPGVLDRLGFDHERLQKLRPGLICASITGFGDTGPYRDRPAFDFIAQAMSGFMSMNGGPDDPPLRSGLPISDLIAGLYAAIGVSAALFRRERTGKGDVVGSSLTQGLISFLSYASSHYFATGETLPRSGNDHPLSAPYGLFQTADGAIAIAPADTTFFTRLVRALDLTELLERPDLATNPQRVERREEVNAKVTERLSHHGNAYWIERLNAAGVPCGPVYSVREVFEDPQFADMAVDVQQPGGDSIRVLGFPIRFRDAPCQIRYPIPDLGEHNDEVFGALGLSKDKISDLRSRGVI